MEIGKKITALAHPNIALVKYWGKRQKRGNLPAVGSISITLDTLYSRTTLTLDPSLSSDVFYLNGAPGPENQQRRVQTFLDLFRQRSGQQVFARVDSENNFPTAAGLASSASGFAALAVAANRAFQLDLSPRELSMIARQGSGSAARSIFGGFVEMHAGEDPDGSDAFAEPLLPPEAWPLHVVICITSTSEKDIGSTEGMERTASTSPFYEAWVQASVKDLAEMRQALLARDFEKLAEISEHSCLKMHGLAMSARPGIVYWNGTTVELMHHIRRLRHQGIPVFFTIDAGPQVKAICLPEALEQVRRELGGIPGVHRLFITGLGKEARIIEDDS
ncbi:MAG: diphosphomevalonate decarboxylase [Calditrichaeota bacterium]|nr:diphosphomevalonate decarboxylase [Calditrichota bacterium]